jgi:regulation of enolase protein 1 (concanavalin A-like superfamily)
VLSLSNDSDQSVHELAITSLDDTSLRLLREGAAVSVQAEFDGERYNARTVSLVSHQP